mmetsp:Transcript_107174/g.228856  ORF Transcript_107174/g.228856 Transcript_107174/m.228856 type:complete len:254 (+) Transcript_107174:1528-2289(+)
MRIPLALGAIDDSPAQGSTEARSHGMPTSQILRVEGIRCRIVAARSGHFADALGLRPGLAWGRRRLCHGVADMPHHLDRIAHDIVDLNLPLRHVHFRCSPVRFQLHVQQAPEGRRLPLAEGRPRGPIACHDELFDATLAAASGWKNVPTYVDADPVLPIGSNVLIGDSNEGSGRQGALAHTYLRKRRLSDCIHIAHVFHAIPPLDDKEPTSNLSCRLLRDCATNQALRKIEDSLLFVLRPCKRRQHRQQRQQP